MGNGSFRIDAKADDPWVSVSDLGEFAFCPRAGKLAAEREVEDTGEDYEPRAVVRSFYSIPQLEREIAKRTWILIAYGVAFLLFVLALPIIPWILFVAALGLIFLYKTAPDYGLGHTRAQLKKAKDDLRIALMAVARAPSLEKPKAEKVNWWCLLQAGFESTRPMDLLRDTEWRLCGKPWRVLKFGSYRIPVFRKKITGTDTEKDQRLYHQHYVRVAAYCRLLEATEGGQSPFGIVMFGPTYFGVTVPLTDDLVGRVKGSIVGMRTLVKSKQDPPPPSNTGLCRECPNGRPEAYARSPRFMHSECGDRFRWQPPHRKLDEIKFKMLSWNANRNDG